MPPCCTSPGPGQAGKHELGTPSHNVREDQRAATGRRDSPFLSIPTSFCFGEGTWHAINSQKSHSNAGGSDAKGDCCAGCPALAVGLLSLVLGAPFGLCCFLTIPYKKFSSYHHRAPPGQLGKIPTSFCLFFFLCVCIHTHICMYIHILQFYILLWFNPSQQI